MRIEHKIVGVFVVAEEADLPYLSPGTAREVGPLPESRAVSVAAMLQDAVDRERAERFASL